MNKVIAGMMVSSFFIGLILLINSVNLAMTGTGLILCVVSAFELGLEREQDGKD